MKKTKLLILSDLHLERRHEGKKEFLLQTINENISHTRQQGLEPIVVFAGDVDNCTSGFEWLSRINAKVLYVAGNHEFWAGDYYEVLDALKTQAPPNVFFLNNDVAICGQYLVLGTTLWTDVGMDLNSDIFTHAASRMNDMVYIKAKQWYENPKNIQNLKQHYKGYDIEQQIQNHAWNGLIELEENKKAWDFLNYANDVLEVFKKVHDVAQNAKNDVNSKYQWRNISKETSAKILNNIEHKKKEINWSEFIQKLFELPPNYKISEDKKEQLLGGNLSQKDKLFQQLRKIDDIAQKEIVILSHHLPFYEEILVGTMMYDTERQIPRLHNTVNEKLFLIREGQSYPGHNYLFRATKGELERNNDITHIVNYYNNGAKKLGNFLAENTKIWIHGHEHHFNYCDYVKNIQIVTNPIGIGLNVFDFDENNQPKINDHYLKYHNIKEKDYDKEFEKLKNAFIRSPNDNLNSKNLKDATQLWALKHYDWDSHSQLLTKIDSAAKEILLLSVQYIKLEESEEEAPNTQEKLDDLENKISLWCDAYNMNCQKLVKMHSSLRLSFNVRTESDFNMQSWTTQAEDLYDDIFSWTMGNANIPQQIPDGFIGRYSAQKSFEAQENIKIAHKYCKRVQDFLNKTQFKHLYQVDQKEIEEFNKKSATSIDKFRMTEKISEKWNAFYERALEPFDSSKRKNNLDF